MPPESHMNEPSSPVPASFVGSVHHAAIDSFLSKRLSLRSLVNVAKKTAAQVVSQSSHHEMVAFVSSTNVNYEKSKKGTIYAPMTGRSVYFVTHPLTTQLLPCLCWHRDWRGSDSMVPRLVPLDTVHSLFRVVDTPSWIELMCRLQERTIRPLLKCLTFASDDLAKGIMDEVSKRLSQFGAFDNTFFFQNVRDILTWDIATHWAAWERANNTLIQRRDSMCDRWQIRLTERDFLNMTPDKDLERFKNPPPFEDIPACADKVREVAIKLVDAHIKQEPHRSKNTKSMDPVWSQRSPLPFSKGGYFEEFLYRSNKPLLNGFPPRESIKDDQGLSETLWWWRYRENWPPLLQEEFPDNWERSAFLYELRARLLPERSWDIFHRPWSQLDASQRAVLYYLWPPERQGKHWRSSRVEHDLLASLDLNARLTMDGRGTHEELNHLHQQHRFWRHELLGIDDLCKRKRPP